MTVGILFIYNYLIEFKLILTKSADVKLRCIDGIITEVIFTVSNPV